MDLINRTFSYETDLDDVRKFLLEIYQLTGSLQYLIPIKIENHKYGPCGPSYTKKDDEDIKIWEIESKKVAISHRGSAENYHIEVHPEFKQLEREIFLKIEDFEVKKKTKGKIKSLNIYMYTVETDELRTKTLLDLQYTNHGLHEYNYIISNIENKIDYRIPEGFIIRNINGESDLLSLIKVIGSVFQHCASYMTVEKLLFMHQAEFYSPDLDLIAVAPNSEFAAFCMFRFDPLTKIAELEIIGAKQEYKNLGLEKALIYEGLYRLRKYNPKMVCAVEIDVSDELNKIISSVGFKKQTNMYIWRKVL